MIETNPNPTAVDAATFAECSKVCFDCAQVCTSRADTYLGEQEIQTLVKCIRDDPDCADICAATATCSPARRSLRQR